MKIISLVSVSGIWTKVLFKLVFYISHGFGVWKGRFLLRQNWPFSRIFSVHFQPCFRLRINVRHDGFNRTFRLTDAAIDTFIRVDDERVFAFVEAVYRADFHAIGVLTGNADVGHYKGHGVSIANFAAGARRSFR